jgi:hypothetical protein
MVVGVNETIVKSCEDEKRKHLKLFPSADNVQVPLK